MLTKKQIEIMAKPYTNKRVIMLGTITVMGDDWWGNGHVAFLDEAPPTEKDYPKKGFDKDKDLMEATEGHRDIIDNLIATAEVAVYPVEIRPNTTREYAGIEAVTVLRFTDGKELNLWANARYVATIQKRHERELTWKTPSAASDMLVAYDNGPVAVLMAMRPDGWDKEPEWCLKNGYIEEVGK